MCYHGTKRENLLSILEHGLRTSETGLYLRAGEKAAYLSPSIEYAAHPRFANVWKYKGKYIQTVLQLRIRGDVAFQVELKLLQIAKPFSFLGERMR